LIVRAVVVTLPAAASGSFEATPRTVDGLAGVKRIRGIVAENSGVYTLTDGANTLSRHYATQQFQPLDIAFDAKQGPLTITWALAWAPGTPFSFTLFVQE
jgi:hypothetical protein